MSWLFKLRRRLRAVKAFNQAWAFWQTGHQNEAVQMWKTGEFIERMWRDPLPLPRKMNSLK